MNTVLVTLAFSSWTQPLGWTMPGYPTTNISFHRIPSSGRHTGAGDPMRLFLRYGLVSHPSVGEYEF